MIIAIEAQRLFREKKHGMEIVSLEIIREIQHIDKTNEFILFTKNDADNNCVLETTNFTINNKLSGPYPIWEQIRLPNAIKKLSDKPSFLHCTANTAPIFTAIPLIVTIHDIIYLEAIKLSGSMYQIFGNLYRRMIVPIIAKKAKVIITVSHYEKKIISEKLNISSDKIKVVYNAANKQFEKISNSVILENFRQEKNLPSAFMLHFGNTAPKKNTIGVLKAYQLYKLKTEKPLPIVITDCSKEYLYSLLKSMNAEELINNIVIPGYIKFEQIPYLYNLSTIFLYPSHRESFGMPVIEAMSCGVPVITSNTSALPEIAGNAASLINPENPLEICNEIIHLISNKLYYEEKVERGFKNAERFSWKNAALETLKIYKEMSM